ncbi:MULTISPECIES: hypothetical protein [unclassified Microcoleus]|uniref:hypothetical protein n=1 Tax=unclassified Microcoleus TaxID=2642155 RepID=UPI002FD4CCE2
MAQIVPSEGGTFTGDTGEKIAFQSLSWWQYQEDNKSVNPNDEQYFTGTKNTDTDNKFFEGTWKIPAIFTPKPLGMVAGSIYQGLTFVPGTGGTFSGATPEAYTLEVLLWLVQRQNNTSEYNPDKLEYITATYNANQLIWEGTFKLPYQTILLPNGSVQDTARAYLL